MIFSPGICSVASRAVREIPKTIQGAMRRTFFKTLTDSLSESA